MSAETFEAKTTWVERAGRLYVAADDVIALLYEGGYDTLAGALARVAADEARERAERRPSRVPPIVKHLQP